MASCWVPLRMARHLATTRNRSFLARRSLELRQKQLSVAVRFSRSLHLGPAMMPPVLFTGLFIALWCWKCTMLVMFQNTIIYNPFLPPDARRAEIADYVGQCRGITWRKQMIDSLDGTPIALCVSDEDPGRKGSSARPVYVLYFQGTWYKVRK